MRPAIIGSISDSIREAELAAEDWGEYFIGGEPVEEAAYLQQTAAYQTGDVTGYKPKLCSIPDDDPILLR